MFWDSFRRIPSLHLAAGGLILAVVSGQAADGGPVVKPPVPTVYAVIAVDTENGSVAWYASGKPRQNDPLPLFDTSQYKPGDPETATVFSDAFRRAHRDSFGNPFVVSWFAEMDALFGAATYQEEGPSFPELTGKAAGYTAVRDTLLRYWRPAIERFGDGIYWHHHIQAWMGTRWGANAEVMSGYTHHFDALNHMLLDRAFYPSVFRSGWLWQDDQLSRFLNDWMPFDYTASAGPWHPVHPRLGGGSGTATGQTLNRWSARSNGGASPAEAAGAFQEARANGVAIFSINFHDRENMPAQIAQFAEVLVAAQAKFPDVSFRYASALEGGQAALKLTDRRSPRLTVVPVSEQLLQIVADEALWQNRPYVAALYRVNAEARYVRLETRSAGPNSWMVQLNPARGDGDAEAGAGDDAMVLVRVGVGGADLAGNAATVLVEF